MEREGNRRWEADSWALLQRINADGNSSTEWEREREEETDGLSHQVSLLLALWPENVRRGLVGAYARNSISEAQGAS